MRTKERFIKLIFSAFMCCVFIWLFSTCSKTLAVTIKGNVEDENGSPIEGMAVDFNGSTYNTTSSGYYEVTSDGDKLTYSFPSGSKYKEPAKATSKMYKVKDVASTKKYNIVIVRPESGNEGEYKTIEELFGNCNQENKKVITYNSSGFSDGITDPYSEYKKICGSNYLSNGYINMFVVIANGDMPVINMTKEQGKLSDGNIVYNTDTGMTKIPKYAQVSSMFNEEVIPNICDYAKIEIIEEELPVTISDTNAVVTLKDKTKNQRVELQLTKLIEDAPGEYIGNYIEGYVYTLEGDTPLKKTDGTTPIVDKDGNELIGTFIKGVGVQLYNKEDGSEAKDKDGNTLITRTDEKGYYKFENLEGAAMDPVTLEIIKKYYTVKFTYGDKEQFELLQATTYNGNDYESTEAKYETKIEEVITSLETEELEEEVVEPIVIEDDTKLDIYLVIDCSGSMNGLPLGLVSQGATKFVNDVFDKYGDNARIGLVTYNCMAFDFGGLVTSALKEQLINNGINIMEAGGGTATYAGIDLAKELLNSQGRTDAEKVMIVLTDGMSDGNKTTKSYIEAAEKGIRILTVLYNLNSTFFGPMIEKTIGAGEFCYANGNEIIDVLGIDAIRYIEGESIGHKTKPQKIVDESTEIIETKIQKVAQDDSTRREETINKLNEEALPSGKDAGGIGYYKGVLLRQLDEYVSGTDYTEVSDLTHMTASGEVVIDNLNPDDNIGYDMNLVLKERVRLEPEVKKEVKTIKITLSDNNILIYKDIDNAENNIGTIISNIEQHLAVMDDELIHGATLEIKYKITVNDNGAPFNGKYTVYDYIDEEVTIKECAGWIEISDQEREERIANIVDGYGYGEDEVRTLLEDKQIIKREFGPGDTEAELIVSRLLATNSTDEYENYCEIVKYKNDLARRICGVTPASLDLTKIFDDDEANNLVKSDLEKDEAKAELVNIIPPFGRGNNMFINLTKYIMQKEKFLLHN